jgi:uncharacterized protein
MSEMGALSPPLPATIPIFPLAGVLLLPRGHLPLNIFEPRYLAMTRDALSGERLIGMIQPTDPASAERNPPVYPLGCAGKITAFAKTDDGRYLITLTGISRFGIRAELPLLDGYRRVEADWSAFLSDRDGEEEGPFDRERLLRALALYLKQRRIAADWDAIIRASGERLVTAVAMLAPFAPSEKQALLEAPGLGERARLLMALIEMAALDPVPTRPAARN